MEERRGRPPAARQRAMRRRPAGPCPLPGPQVDLTGRRRPFGRNRRLRREPEQPRGGLHPCADVRAGAVPGLQVALAAQLLVRGQHRAARNAELEPQKPGGRKPSARSQQPVQHRRAQCPRELLVQRRDAGPVQGQGEVELDAGPHS